MLPRFAASRCRSTPSRCVLQRGTSLELPAQALLLASAPFAHPISTLSKRRRKARVAEEAMRAAALTAVVPLNDGDFAIPSTLPVDDHPHPLPRPNFSSTPTNTIDKIRYAMYLPRAKSLPSLDNAALEAEVFGPSRSEVGYHNAYHFERLEFHGDRELNAIAADVCFVLGPASGASAAWLQVNFTLCTSNQTAKELADYYGLRRLCAGLLGASDKALSDRFEAYISALYLMKGRDATREFLAPHFYRKIMRTVPVLDALPPISHDKPLLPTIQVPTKGKSSSSPRPPSPPTATTKENSLPLSPPSTPFAPSQMDATSPDGNGDQTRATLDSSSHESVALTSDEQLPLMLRTQRHSRLLSPALMFRTQRYAHKATRFYLSILADSPDLAQSDSFNAIARMIKFRPRLTPGPPSGFFLNLPQGKPVYFKLDRSGYPRIAVEIVKRMQEEGYFQLNSAAPVPKRVLDPFRSSPYSPPLPVISLHPSPSPSIAPAPVPLPSHIPVPAPSEKLNVRLFSPPFSIRSRLEFANESSTNTIASLWRSRLRWTHVVTASPVATLPMAIVSTALSDSLEIRERSLTFVGTKLSDAKILEALTSREEMEVSSTLDDTPDSPAAEVAPPSSPVSTPLPSISTPPVPLSTLYNVSPSADSPPTSDPSPPSHDAPPPSSDSPPPSSDSPPPSHDAPPPSSDSPPPSSDSPPPSSDVPPPSSNSYPPPPPPPALEMDSEARDSTKKKWALLSILKALNSYRK